jgi:hypothetical protein
MREQKNKRRKELTNDLQMRPTIRSIIVDCAEQRDSFGGGSQAAVIDMSELRPDTAIEMRAVGRAG